MFPSSAILEEMFPSDRDGNDIRRRYASSATIWRSGFNQRRVYAEAFSGVQMEIELKIISRMRSLGLSSVHVSP